MTKITKQIQEKAYDIILQFAEKKYDEEIKRNDIINTKAGFLLTAISILIGTLIALLCSICESNYFDYKLANVFILVAMFLLLISFVLTIISQLFYKRNYIPHIDSVIDALNKSDIEHNNDLSTVVISTYNQTIKSIDYVNSRCTKFLMYSFSILIWTIILSIIFAIIIYIRSFCYE